MHSHTHTHTLSLTRRSKHTSQHCSTCHPRNHQRDTADTRGSVRRLVLSGVTVGKKKKKKDEDDDSKISTVRDSDRRRHAGCHLALPQRSLHPPKPSSSLPHCLFSFPELLSPAKISTFLSWLALKLPRVHTGHLAQKMQLSTWVVHLCRDQKEKKNESQP